MEYPKDCLYVWFILVTLKHLKQYIERKESFLQRRYMLHFIASSILSGIIWDKNYIRVVKLPVTTELHLDTGLLPDSYDWKHISDSCQTQELWMCLRYANLELGFSEKNEAFYENFSYKMLEENSGFLLVHAIEGAKYLENVKNTVFIKYTDSDYKYFILGKCLYADADGYMMALLSYSGLSYEDFVDSTDKKVVRMRKCFDSIRQINYNGESMQIGNE